MTAKLSREDFDLLNELNRKYGRARISDGKPRQAADRLVAAKCATSHSLNLSDIEYEITPLGHTTLVLDQFGLGHHEISTMTVEPQRFDVDGRWLLKVSSLGNGATLMEIGQATKIASHLRAVGADALAGRFETETERTRRYARNPA